MTEISQLQLFSSCPDSLSDLRELNGYEEETLSCGKQGQRSTGYPGGLQPSNAWPFRYHWNFVYGGLLSETRKNREARGVKAHFVRCAMVDGTLYRFEAKDTAQGLRWAEGLRKLSNVARAHYAASWVMSGFDGHGEFSPRETSASALGSAPGRASKFLRSGRDKSAAHDRETWGRSDAGPTTICEASGCAANGLRQSSVKSEANKLR